MGITKKNKFAGLNLLISLIIIAAFLIFAWLIWFPEPFAKISGFYKSAQIMLLVNLCLGPLLVFLIYKENKKNLKLDLVILAVLQLSAFIFGMYSIYLKHPVYVVFTVDRFSIVNARDATPDKIRYALLKTSFLSSPKLVFAKRPDEPELRRQLLFSVLFDGKADLDKRAEYYEPFANHLSSVFKRSINTKILFPDESTQLKLTKFLKQHGGSKQDYAYFPFQGNTNKDIIWVIDKKNGNFIDTIDSDPWQVANR